MKSLTFILFVFLSISVYSQVEKESTFDIVGKWEPNDNSEYGFFTFDKEGFALIENQGVILGGKKYERSGMEFSLTYKIDLEKKPIELDLTFTELNSKRQLIWYFILKKINEDKILIVRGLNGTRPVDFDDNSITLKRRK